MKEQINFHKKLAVTDACIFIELDQLNLYPDFFKLDIELHTSVDVFNELHAGQQKILKAYETGKLLYIHTIGSEERILINSGKYAAGLSQNDRTVLFLAEKLDAMVLSTDNLMRKHAKRNALEFHGMIWILDVLVDAKLISRIDAANKLRQMIGQNVIYQNNTELLKETGKRLSAWEKK